MHANLPALLAASTAFITQPITPIDTQMLVIQASLTQQLQHVTDNDDGRPPTYRYLRGSP